MVLAWALLLGLTTQAAAVVLPDLRTLDCMQATQRLRALHIARVECRTGSWRADFAPGRVNEIEPKPGTGLPLPQGTTVVLSLQPAAAPPAPTPPVPVPAPRFEVPNVVGLPEYTAVGRIGQFLRPLRIGPAAANGRTVLRQRPEAPTRLPLYGQVELTLGLTIPSLLDLDCDAARQRAAEFGHTQFTCDARPADAPDQPLGQVVEQAPPPSDTPVAEPVAIRVVVRSAEQATVPDVLGQPLADAIAAIVAARLVAAPDADDGERDVRTQRPNAGSLADVGSPVALRTYRVVVVPNVVGANLNEALSTLRDASLRARPDAADAADARDVAVQEPVAGTRVTPKTAIRLVTRLMARVPDLIGRDCAGAHAAINGTAFALDCEAVGDAWRQWLEQPRIASQSPAVDERAATGTVIRVEQRPTTPVPLRWLARQDPALAGGGVAAALLLLGAGLWRLRPSRPLPPVGVTAQAHWRAEPDLRPAVHLRLSTADAAHPHTTAAPPTWRLVPDDAPRALLRGLVPKGERDEHR